MSEREEVSCSSPGQIDVTLLQILEHPLFEQFVASNRIWRVQSKLKDIFLEILKEITGEEYERGHYSNIHQVTSLFLRKAKSKPYLKTTWRTLKEAETMWLENIVVAKYSDSVRQELIEKPTVRLVSSPDTQSPRKERKTYSNCSENWKIRTVTQLLKRICSDKQLEEDVLSRLQRRAKKRATQKEDKTDERGFNSYLSCFNCIDGANLSMNGWDFVRFWIKDYVSRGGDILKLPNSNRLRIYREEMVPKGLLCSATTARIPLQNMFDNTAQCLQKRPDLQSYLDQLEDGTVLELLWKWGLDGQTGE